MNTVVLLFYKIEIILRIFPHNLLGYHPIPSHAGSYVMVYPIECPFIQSLPSWEMLYSRWLQIFISSKVAVTVFMWESQNSNISLEWLSMTRRPRVWTWIGSGTHTVWLLVLRSNACLEQWPLEVPRKFNAKSHSSGSSGVPEQAQMLSLESTYPREKSLRHQCCEARGGVT